MAVIGVTGGVATGKSTVARLIFEKLRESRAEQVESFSADEYAHELLNTNQSVRAEVLQAFGESVFDRKGKINRPLIRELIFNSPSQKTALEGILHPKIRQFWTARSQSFHGRDHYFVAEIPLLYETEGVHHFDCIVAVEANAQVQIERLSSKRGWSLESARRVIDAQMPAAEKIRRADILILNQHTEKLLHDQVDLLSSALLLQYA